jgi:hydrogenase maturation protein HypF
VYGLAQELNLKGWVRNDTEGVLVEIEGDPSEIVSFCLRLTTDPPPLARIDSVHQEAIVPQDFGSFDIIQSRTHRRRDALIPADAASCRECLHDVLNATDRHYGYPFTNCTHCGPRFTIIQDVPYDRINTSMRGFAPCPSCRAEYEDPRDRRFHAQPVACPLCGPGIQVLDDSGTPVVEPGDWLPFCWDKLAEGKILAVKGLGGFHLACVLEEPVIARLRVRKQRPFKPFAIMCRGVETIATYCEVDDGDLDVLASSASPITLMRMKRDTPMPRSVNPGMATLGVMLPYTPLHFLLLQGPFDAMVLTSANPSDQPLISENDEALKTLRGIADLFLVHNRDIVQRCDDSVVRVINKRVQVIRRSRGYVPDAIDLSFATEKPVLGVGGDMKNTFCILKGQRAFMSQHLGEMGTMESEAFFLEALRHFERLLDSPPEVLGHDLHPAYHTALLAKGLKVPWKYAIQHHHAHFASCLAEHGHEGPAIGVILDGTGFGLDGVIWGFEIITGDHMDFQRHYHQRYVPLLGGEGSIRWPWRMALSYLYQTLGETGVEIGSRLFGSVGGKELDILFREARSLQNSIPTSSCGRLFDAVAALLGICHHSTYEGQAAIQMSELLEGLDPQGAPEAYPVSIGEGKIDFSPMFSAICEEITVGREVVTVVKRFHDTVVEAIAKAVDSVSYETFLETVALSGGVWQNPYLIKRATRSLTEQGMNVLVHDKVPTNDGGLALGQAVIAYRRWQEDVSRGSNAGKGDM